MWKNWLIFILGIILILIPFLGLPLSFLRATYVVLGLVIVVTSFLAARDLHLITLHLNSLPSTTSKDDDYVNTSISEIVEDENISINSTEKLT